MSISMVHGELIELPVNTPTAGDLKKHFGGSKDTLVVVHWPDGRDPGGDQVRAGKVLTYTFSGAVEIAPQRFLDSGVEVVECPTCAAMHSLEPRRGAFRFPSHSSCKTRPPQSDQRWVMRETIREMAGG